ncbi:NADP-dependent glyceraldehyde-3-phosphate dehydrogenase [Flavobacterium noncentrifugens]|uniref:Acyl-CoA reductase n=1 Tax=Flavobacterium noncentrifugens TaxID=1128970 RepID=A0A1G8XY45_9FLAO|nr:NADP-dependent glyceraldehyde-3-phosphate dehydrogenase [Flavobacterium noncentrifugens]GEP52234.1 NADP-dependent glyceraldehyde-3-phosphate dehydrogenase [Flavobacterium noncentrifugens]SDJ95492.1 Acyl-CoA reductase [Flavobacterium noncentrifugens]
MENLNASQTTIDNLFVAESQIPDQYKLEEIHQREYLLNGKLVPWNGAVSEVFSPVCIPGANGLQRKLLGTIPHTSPKEAMEALDAAVAAYDEGQGEWPTMSVDGRIKCMQKFVYLMIGQRELVIKLLMWEIGKSNPDAAKEFDRTVEYINDTIDALKDLDRQSSRFEEAEGVLAQIRRSPLGVVLSMGPFNYPLNEIFTTLIPALIMGNTILFKLPKYGVLAHYPLLQAFKEAFPAGTVNTLYGKGSEIVTPLMESGKVSVLAFIGSSKVANGLKKLHPKVNRLRSILSLDAKNAAIVTNNADIDVAVNECLLGALSFNGQRCTALKLIFVQKGIAENFVKKLSDAVAALKPGLPWDKEVKITPLPEFDKPAYLKACLDDAVANGAKIINENGGYTNNSFVFPAVVFPVNDQMRLYHEEQFGPIIPIVPFESIEEPIDYQINAPHGMQVSIFSNDAREVSSLIDPFVNLVSRVNINCQSQRGPDVFPFTGRKDSAEGTLSVSDALRSFSIRSLVATKATDANKQLLNTIVRDHDSNFLSTDYIF